MGWKTILLVALGTFVFIAINIYQLAVSQHRQLASAIRNQSISDNERKKRAESGNLSTLPRILVTKPDDFKVIHEIDSWPTPRPLPLKGHQLRDAFTHLMRRNMRLFARFPQSWMLRLIAKTPEQCRSFTQTHINSLKFEKGDLFCGFYRVARREQCHMEVDLELPQSGASMGGMLVLSLVAEDDRYTLSTQTIQWTPKDSGAVLPLERSVFRFMHELASWWLLVTGSRVLKEYKP